MIFKYIIYNISMLLSIKLMKMKVKPKGDFKLNLRPRAQC